LGSLLVRSRTNGLKLEGERVTVAVVAAGPAFSLNVFCATVNVTAGKSLSMIASGAEADAKPDAKAEIMFVRVPVTSESSAIGSEKVVLVWLD
jgi:hypothetical protein